MTNITPFQVSSGSYLVRFDDPTDEEDAPDGPESYTAKLTFDINLMSDTGDDSWIEKAVTNFKACLLAKNSQLLISSPVRIDA
jgi:hypothetical protein